MVTGRARAPRAAAALAISLALAACDAPRCKPIERCDVRTRSCQRAALQHAVCLRGRDESADLEVAVVTQDRDDYLEQARQITEDEIEAAQQMRRGLALFGLAAPPSEAAELRVQRARLVGAFYDSDERRITLIEDGRGRRSGGNVLTLVHEMLHALQDAAGQLAWDEVHSTDQALARGALVEGEATLLSDEAAAEGHGFSFRDLDYARALASYRSGSLAALAASGGLFDVAYMRFAYAFGASYLWPLRRDHGAAALGEAFRDPPVSAYAIMNANPYRPELRDNDLGDTAAPIVPDLTRVGCHRLGRFLYEARARAWDTSLPRTSLPSDVDFVADTLCVFVDAEGEVLATWRVRFTSEAPARQAASSELSPSGTATSTRWEDTDVWWAAGLIDALPGFPTWEPAPAQDFGFEEAEPTASRRIHCPRAAIDGQP